MKGQCTIFLRQELSDFVPWEMIDAFGMVNRGVNLPSFVDKLAHGFVAIGMVVGVKPLPAPDFVPGKVLNTLRMMNCTVNFSAAFLKNG